LVARCEKTRNFADRRREYLWPDHFDLVVDCSGQHQEPTGRDGARRLESAGYDMLLIGDHFSPNSLAPVPALLAAALATTRLRVGCTVFDNDFRHPAALAKEIATADVLSGGRFELGLGAGWNKPEYDKVGMTFDPPAVRVSRFEEAVHIIKGLWKDSPLTFAGRHYAITEYDGQPKPMQRPHPPIFIGGGGKRLLSVAARQADIVGIVPQAKAAGDGLATAEETDACVEKKVGWVRQAAADRFDQLELALLVWAVVVTDDRRAAAERIAARTSRPVDQILESPYYLIGTVDAIVDKLLEQRDRHCISYISVFPSDTNAFAPVVARLAGK
jgi:probable F420-dependent oxidoreductase